MTRATKRAIASQYSGCHARSLCPRPDQHELLVRRPQCVVRRLRLARGDERVVGAVEHQGRRDEPAQLRQRVEHRPVGIGDRAAGVDTAPADDALDVRDAALEDVADDAFARRLAELRRAGAAERAAHHHDRAPARDAAHRVEDEVAVGEARAQRRRPVARAVAPVVDDGEVGARVGEASRRAVVVGHHLAVAVEEEERRARPVPVVEARVEADAGRHLDAEVARARRGRRDVGGGEEEALKS